MVQTTSGHPSPLLGILSPRMGLSAASQTQGMSHALNLMPCIKIRWDNPLPSASLCLAVLNTQFMDGEGSSHINILFSTPLQDVTKDMVQNSGRNGGFNLSGLSCTLHSKKFLSSNFFLEQMAALHQSLNSSKTQFVFYFCEPKVKAHADKNV